MTDYWFPPMYLPACGSGQFLSNPPFALTTMTTEWITDRLPTVEDADADGEVRIPTCPYSDPDAEFEKNYQHWSLIVTGQPWWSEKAADNATARLAKPASRKVVQLSSHEGCVLALTDDGLILSLQEDDDSPDLRWFQLPAIPQPAAGEEA